MRIDKSIKDMPWPEPYLDEQTYDFGMTLAWPVIHGEKLLVATIQRNRNVRRYRQVAADFRLVCSKEKHVAAILYQGDRLSRRMTLHNALWSIGTLCSVSTAYTIGTKDQKALWEWLEETGKPTKGLCLTNLENWVTVAVASETQREKDARGELRDEDVMLCPDEIPQGMIEYIRLHVLPQDEVLFYKKGNVRGTCFQCRQKVRATGGQRFRQHEYATCPNCGKKVHAILEGSESFKADYVENIVAMQLGSDGETVFLRQWHILRDYTAQWENIPAQLEEICRYAIRGNRVAKWQLENKENMYYVAYRYKLSNWTRMQSVSIVYDDRYYFFYPDNWREQLAGTSLRYCSMDEYVAGVMGFKRGHNPVWFLLDWARYPAIEKFWKAGYKELVYDRIRGLDKRTQHTIRWSRDSLQGALRFPTRLLKIHRPEDWTIHDVQKVRELWEQVEAGQLQEKDLPELARSMACYEHIEEAIGHASVHRILKYIGQCVEKERTERAREAERARQENRHYYSGGPLETPGIYRDYLKDCVKLQLDLDDRAVLFPADLNAAHQRTIAQVKHRASELSKETFRKEVERLSWMEWEADGFLIRLPKNGKEITEEGKALHHCVGGYVDRMANGKTTILFVRRVSEPKKPFYTLEWLNGHVQQCRTDRNGDYRNNAEVSAFVDKWVKKVAKKGKPRAARKTA